MIVQCSQCQTRFRIPDEKVTERGVKVRCTKCQHTFRVTRDGPVAGAGEGAAATSPPRVVPTTSRPLPSPPAVSASVPSLPKPPAPTAPSPSVPRPPQAVSPPRPAPPPPPAAALEADLFAPPATPTEALQDDPFARLEDAPRAPSLTPPPTPARVAGDADRFPGDSDRFPAVRAASEGPPAPAPSQPAPSQPAPSPAPFHAPAPEPAQEDVRAAFFGTLPPRPAASGSTAPAVAAAAPPLREPAPAAVSGVRLAPPLVTAPTRPASERGGPGPGRGTAWVVNGLFAALLLVAVGLVGLVATHEGALPLEALRMGEVAPAAPPRLVTTHDVSNGLYDTRTGQPVFFVRGEVENRGPGPTRVQVRVEILDGAQRLRSATGLAGASATPEDLHALATLEDGEALRKRLDASARPLAPGARAPFVVVFVEYPPGLGRYRLEVVAEPAPAQGARAAAH